MEIQMEDPTYDMENIAVPMNDMSLPMSFVASSVPSDLSTGPVDIVEVLDVATVDNSEDSATIVNNSQHSASNWQFVNDVSPSQSPATSSRSSSVDLSDIKVATSSYDNPIMSACSSAAQHLRQTITDALNSRVEEIPTSSAVEDVSSSLEVSVKQKLEDFENTVRNNMSPQAVRQFESPERIVEARSAEATEKSTLSRVVPGDSKEDAECVSNAAVVKEEKSKTDSQNAQDCDQVTSEDAKNKNPVVSRSNSVEEKSLKRSQRNGENKKKGEKSIDQILKLLSNLPTAEEKLLALCKKHSESLDDLKSVESRAKQSERQVIQLTKEKEQLQADHNRMVLAKSRLESLCRELQRQNKAVKEESLLRIREEEEKRKEVASKFQTTLNEISNLMQENSKKNLQLKEENAELAQKLKTLVEHYEMWEKHMEKVVQQKDLEAQLAKAQHAKTHLQLKQETEKFLREKQSLLENMSELQKKCTHLASNELQLRAELGDYTSKYEEFQTVLSKSNQVFATFKTDMEMTSKKIKKLERQTNVWKQKWESSNNALLEMISDKQKREKELINSQQRVLTLEKLCRALQAERNDLQNKVKDANDCEADTAGTGVIISSAV